MKIDLLENNIFKVKPYYTKVKIIFSPRINVLRKNSNVEVESTIGYLSM